MKCPGCGGEITAGARFCAHCGSPLLARCSQCAAELPPGACFCPSCGRAVAGTAGASGASKAAAAGERKQITVLFADFSGFTSFASKKDAEEVRDCMATAWERLDVILLSHGGVVEKHIGDAVMAVFGARQAREDDPEQAVRAALAMQAAIQEWQRDGSSPPLQMRIGIHTGLAVVGPLGPSGDLVATGDTVNLANRLEQNAPLGGVLISQDTFRQVCGLFHLQAQPLLSIKGRTEPVQTYLVVGAKPRGLALQLRGVEGMELEMIGRESEMKRLQSALESVMDERQLQVFTLVGEAGIGKTRLLREFQKWVDSLPQGVRFFFGRATPEMTGLPFALLRNVFCARLEIAESDPPAVARQKLERGLLDLLGATEEASACSPEELALQAQFIGQLLGLDFSASPHLRDLLQDTEQIHHRALHYLSGFFRAVSRSAPTLAAPTVAEVKGTLLVLEDAHWSDDGSLDFVAHLAKACPDAPILILCLARPTLFERRPAWGEGLAAHTRLNLEPLSRRAARDLVELILSKAGDIPAELYELILSSAEGNPFYIEEIIKMLIDQRVIVPGPEQWRIEPDPLAPARVPPTLTGVLQARVDGLTPLERAVAQRASVVGRVFWDSALERLSFSAATPAGSAPVAEGTLTKAQIAEALAGLRRKELIFRRESSAFAGTVEYTFKHELLRNVAYESVLKKLRRGYHAQVADWLIEHSGERIGEFSGLVAAHFEQAGRAPEAAEWYGRAGQQARAGYTPGLALKYFRKALELSPATGAADQANQSRQLDWREGAGEALGAQANFPEAMECYAGMRDLAQTLGDLPAQARAWNGLAYLHERQGNNRASILAAEQAETLAGRAGPAGRREQIRALHLKGWALYRLGDAASVLALGEQTLKLCAETGDRSAMAVSYKLDGVAHLQLGHFAEAEGFFQQGLALCQEFGDRRNAAAMWSNLGESARLRGDCQSAIELYQKAITIARQIGHRDSEVIYLNNLAGARLGLGQHAQAETDLRQVITLAGGPKSCTLSETYSFLAAACLGQQRLQEAMEAAQSALALAKQSENHLDLGGAWRALGEVAASRPAPATPDQPVPTAPSPAPVPEPAVCFRESLRVFKDMNAEGEQARTLRAWAAFDRQQGRLEQARERAAAARQIFLRLSMQSEVEKIDVPEAPGSP